jgi:NAD(P)-dependent dehydrogenase (short-subunit alcohol dehydrogenase family)
VTPSLRTAVVAGADSTLGLACCEILLSAGCRHLIALCDTPGGMPSLRDRAPHTTLEVPEESLDSVIGVARVLDLLRQRAPWDVILLVSSLRGTAARTHPDGDAAWTLAAAQGARPQLWLVPPHDAGPVGAAAAAACAQYLGELAALSPPGGIRAGCLQGDDADVLASLRAAFSPASTAAAR